MSDDLTISTGEAEEEEALVEFTTREEYVSCAYSALVAISDLDPGLMRPVNQLRIQRIRRKCLRILDECVNEMYSELFDEREDDE
jgi:hypothetical protein